jgi:hypothetical protein
MSKSISLQLSFKFYFKSKAAINTKKHKHAMPNQTYRRETTPGPKAVAGGSGCAVS